MSVVRNCAETYCFKWSNYNDHLSAIVKELLDQKCMVDVTLCAEGQKIQAHRLVLSASSTFFYDIFSQTNEEHPVIILSDVSAQNVRSIVEFSYHGEVRTPAEEINNFLAAAHSLKICGLMDIDRLDESELSNTAEECEEEESFTLYEDFNEIPFPSPNVSTLENAATQISTQLKPSYSSPLTFQCKRQKLSPKPLGIKLKRRKSSIKKEYTDEQLEAAISDVKNGKSLIDASVKHNIPRSTLYMRAKILNISLNQIKTEYTLEDMTAAIQLVLAGSSLQQAADCYGIPKTVLWRRIQTEESYACRRDTRKNYDPEIRQAAIKALENGQSLSKVSQEYQIPKTTLFRDRTKLVIEGKLPREVYKKRVPEEEALKNSRLEEAVAACKDGKMSQAAAAAMFHVPKTSIWRRLQKSLKSELGNDSEEILDKPQILNLKYESSEEGEYVTIYQESPTEDNFISCGLEINESTSEQANT